MTEADLVRENEHLLGVLEGANATAIRRGKERDESIANNAQLVRENAELRASLEESEQRADRLYKDRYALLECKSTDGLSSSEWLMRTATAEMRAKELAANNARLREAYDPFVEMWRDAYDPDEMTDVDLGNKLYWLDQILAETPAVSLEAIRAEERAACAKRLELWYSEASERIDKYEILQAVEWIRARGDGGEVAG